MSRRFVLPLIAALMLVWLAAALPIDDRFEWQGGWWFVALWILVAATALLVVVRRHDRLTVAEILGALVALGVALLLAATRGSRPGPEQQSEQQSEEQPEQQPGRQNVS